MCTVRRNIFRIKIFRLVSHRRRKMLYTGGAKHILSYQHSQPKCDVRIAFSPNQLCCAKHNQHAKHANARGVWGHVPQENFENYIL